MEGTVKENVLILSEDEVNFILKYLGTKPFNEVYQIIDMLQTKWAEQNKTDKVM